jgi:hypothetical protein
MIVVERRVEGCRSAPQFRIWQALRYFAPAHFGNRADRSRVGSCCGARSRLVPFPSKPRDERRSGCDICTLPVILILLGYGSITFLSRQCKSKGAEGEIAGPKFPQTDFWPAWLFYVVQLPPICPSSGAICSTRLECPSGSHDCNF